MCLVDCHFYKYVDQVEPKAQKISTTQLFAVYQYSKNL